VLVGHFMLIILIRCINSTRPKYDTGMKISCIDYGAGNLWSIQNAFKTVGVGVVLASRPQELRDADAVVLPGVGSFGDAMGVIEPFKGVIMQKISSGVPFLGLCLGIQVLMDESEESRGVKGLGVFKGSCKKFSSARLKVPHMGWNTVNAVRETPILEGVEDGSYFYFVHSYYVSPKDRSVVAGETEYGIRFPSIISQKNIFATQFHPEKSGENGLRIIENFARSVKR